MVMDRFEHCVAGALRIQEYAAEKLGWSARRWNESRRAHRKERNMFDTKAATGENPRKSLQANFVSPPR